MCCGGGGKAPKPDKNIGLAALRLADISAEELGIAREELAWNKSRWEEQKPRLEALADQQIEMGKTSVERSAESWKQYQDYFAPIERQLAGEAANEGGQDQQLAEGDKARATVASSYEGSRQAQARDLARSGVSINPGSEASIARDTQSRTAEAADQAGAANTAMTNARLRGIALRQGVSALGRGLPSTSIASDQSALSASTAAGGSINAATMARNAGVNSALPWFSGATQASAAGGNMLLGQYGTQVSAYNAQQAADASGMAGLGSFAGMVMGGSKAPWWMGAAKGGVLKRGGFVRRGYAAGGIVGEPAMPGPAGGVVRGPGDGSVDTVPAQGENGEQLALANGEGVLNKPATLVVGEDFVHRINKVGLMLEAIARRGVANQGEMRAAA